MLFMPLSTNSAAQRTPFSSRIPSLRLAADGLMAYAANNVTAVRSHHAELLSIFMNDSPRPAGDGRSVHPTGSSVRAKLHPGR